MKSSRLSIGSPKNLSALRFERQQAALDGADRRRRDIAVLGGELARVVAHVLEHRAQVLEVEQQQAAGVGDLEHQVQHAGLGVVEFEHARQQQRPHVGNGGAHRVAFSPKTSQSVVGHAPQTGSGRPCSARRALSLSVGWPAWEMPVKSPLRRP
jgi:hypothetical protein